MGTKATQRNAERPRAGRRSAPPAYLLEDRDAALAALRAAPEPLLQGRPRWQTTFWTRSRADAAALHELLRPVAAREGRGRFDASVELVNARPSDGEDGHAEPRWGVRLTVRLPGAPAGSC